MIREELDQILRGLLTEFDIDLSEGHIYYQPPSNTFIKHPAFIYTLSGLVTASADDNKLYQLVTEYELHWLHSSPDIDMVLKVLRTFPFSSYTMRTTENSIYNDSFRIQV